MIWHKGEGYPGEGQDPTWWTLDSDVAAIHVQSLADIVPVLRQVTEEEVRQKLELMQSLRYKFTFQVRKTYTTSSIYMMPAGPPRHWSLH